MCGLKKIHHSDGSKSYYTKSGSEAISRLQSTGAAAGFEYAANEKDRENQKSKNLF